MFRLGRRKHDEKVESFANSSFGDLVALFAQSAMVESEIRCGSAAASKRDLQQAQREVQRRGQIIVEFSARESDPNSIAEIGDSDDALGQLLSSIVCSLGLYERAKEIEYEKELQCLSGLLCSLCHGTDRLKRKACSRVLGLVVDVALFSRLLNLEMPFWIKYNTVCVVASFVENDPQLFLPLVARSSLLPALSQLLRCNEHEVSLRDAVVQCLKLISSPVRLQATCGDNPSDDDSIPAQLLRLLVFENCLEELIRIVKDEGGIHFSWTSLKHQAVVAMVKEVSVEPLRPISPLGPSTLPSLGSLDSVLDCLVTIRQLITSSVEALKYFEMNDLIVSLSTALSFSVVREMSFAEVPSQFDKAGQVLLPPFARQHSDTSGVPLVLERLLLEMSTILLTTVTYRRSSSEGRLNKLAQALATDQGATPSILHCVSNWITYFGTLTFHLSESSCELSCDGQMFLCNCLATLHQFLQNGASRKYLVSFFTEKNFENLLERECRGGFSFADFSTIYSSVLHPTIVVEAIPGSFNLLCSLFRLCCCDCQEGPWSVLAKQLASDVFFDLYPDVSCDETHEALLSSFTRTNDLFSISCLVPLSISTVISMQRGSTSHDSLLYGSVFCQLLVRAKRCVTRSDNDRTALIVLCQTAVVLLESLLLARTSLKPLQGTIECLVTHLLSIAPLITDGDLLGLSAYAVVLALLAVGGGAEQIVEDANNIDKILLKHYNRFLIQVQTVRHFEGAISCLLAASDPFPLDSQTGVPLFLLSSSFEQCVAQWAASSLLVGNFVIPPPAPRDNLAVTVASRVSSSLTFQEGMGNAEPFGTERSSLLFEVRSTQSFFAVSSHIKSHLLIASHQSIGIPSLILSALYKEANRIRVEDEMLKSAEKMRSSMNIEVCQARDAVEAMTNSIARLTVELQEAQALLKASTERECDLRSQLEQHERRIAASISVWNAHHL